MIVQLLTMWRALLTALVLGLLIGGGTVWKVRDWMAAEARADQADAEVKAGHVVVAQTQRAAEITQDTGQRTEAARERVRIEYRTITERIPVYVTPEADRSVDVPVGFVRLHDAAASGSAATLSDSPGQSADATSGVALSAVAGTVVGNYAQCLDWRAQVIGWQEWYGAQRGAWDKPPA